MTPEKLSETLDRMKPGELKKICEQGAHIVSAFRLPGGFLYRWTAGQGSTGVVYVPTNDSKLEYDYLAPPIKGQVTEGQVATIEKAMSREDRSGEPQAAEDVKRDQDDPESSTEGQDITVREEIGILEVENAILEAQAAFLKSKLGVVLAAIECEDKERLETSFAILHGE